MKITTIRVTAALVGVVVTTGVVAGMSSAHFGGGFGFNSEKRQEAKEAIANNDYDAWVEAVGSDSKHAEKINEAKFGQLV